MKTIKLFMCAMMCIMILVGYVPVTIIPIEAADNIVYINSTYTGSNDITREYQTWNLALPKIAAGDEIEYTIPSGSTVVGIVVPAVASKITFLGTGILDGSITLNGVPGVFNGITQGTGTSQQYVYGGGGANTNFVTSSITIISGSLRGIVGGGNANNAYVGTTNIIFNGGTTNNIWGGGHNTGANIMVGVVNLLITGAARTLAVSGGNGDLQGGWVFGGGFRSKVGLVNMTINTTGTFSRGVFGGSHYAPAVDETIINFQSGTINYFSNGLLHAGGYLEGNITPKATVNISGGAFPFTTSGLTATVANCEVNIVGNYTTTGTHTVLVGHNYNVLADKTLTINSSFSNAGTFTNFGITTINSSRTFTNSGSIVNKKEFKLNGTIGGSGPVTGVKGAKIITGSAATHAQVIYYASSIDTPNTISANTGRSKEYRYIGLMVPNNPANFGWVEVLPITIFPKNMVSYKGGNSTTDDPFPDVVFEAKDKNSNIFNLNGYTTVVHENNQDNDQNITEFLQY